MELELNLEMVYMDSVLPTLYCSPRDRILAKFQDKIRTMEQNIFNRQATFSPAQDVGEMEYIESLGEQIELMKLVVKTVEDIQGVPLLNTRLESQADYIRSELEYLLKGNFNTAKLETYRDACCDILKKICIKK